MVHSRFLSLLIGLLIVSGSHVQSARILGVFPIFAKSHHKVFQAIMKTLALAGHEVVVYSPFPLDNPHPNYTDVRLELISRTEEQLTEHILKITELPHWKCLDVLWDNDELMYESFMKDKKIKKLLSSGEHFDLFIGEMYTMQELALIVGHTFKVPTIGIQAYFTISLANSHSGNSLSLSTIPDACTAYSNRMTLTERLVNSFAILRGLYYHYNHRLPRIERMMREEFPNMPPLMDMIDNISLTFINDHLTADYAQPRTPNIIPVAGIQIDDEKPLLQNIKTFIDEAPEGVILFSLGTYVPDELQPKEYFDMHIKVFEKLRHRVLWKTRKENIQGLPSNVMTLKWTPQRDILAHPKCVLFITHAGLNSLHEAINFGVPVVAIPQFFDQHRNAKFYESQGIGVKIEIKDLTETTISTAIQTVLGNPRYAENMKRLSRIFRDRPLSPAESVVFWTEYVLRHGGAGHLRPASTQLHWYQLALLDVLAAVLAVILVAVVTLILIIRKIFMLLHSRRKDNHQFSKKIN